MSYDTKIPPPLLPQTLEARSACKNYPNTLYSDITPTEPSILVSFTDLEGAQWCFEPKELQQFINAYTQSDCQEIPQNPWNRSPFTKTFMEFILEFYETPECKKAIEDFDAPSASSGNQISDTQKKLSELEDILQSKGMREGFTPDPYISIASYLECDPTLRIVLWKDYTRETIIDTLYNLRNTTIGDISILHVIIKHADLKKQIGADADTDEDTDGDDSRRRGAEAPEAPELEQIINSFFKINHHLSMLNAIESEDHDQLRNLVNLGATAEDARYDNNEILLTVCEEGYSEALVILHDVYGLNRSDVLKDNSAAMQLAASSGQIKILQILHDVYGMTKEDALCGTLGKKIASDFSFETCLDVACYNGHADVVVLLHNLYGMGYNEAVLNECLSLRNACVNGDPFLVILLHTKFGMGKHEAHIAQATYEAIDCGHFQVLKCLKVYYGCEFDATTPWFKTAVSRVVEDCDYSTLKVLAKYYNLRFTRFQRSFFMQVFQRHMTIGGYLDEDPDWIKDFVSLANRMTEEGQGRGSPYGGSQNEDDKKVSRKLF
jgi:hypothetical protein